MGSLSHRITPLVIITSPRGRYTHTQTYTHAYRRLHRNYFKKPGECLVWKYIIYQLKHRYKRCMIKYSTRGGVKWQIQHKAKPSAVFIIQHKCTALLQVCWFCVEGLITLYIEDWENGFVEMQKQAEADRITCYSLSLLPNRWEMNGARKS